MSDLKPARPIELLAPAANTEIAAEAILHGADAVYIGASSHGARKNAANSIDDIKRLVEFAHPFRAKIYVTVNTIVYEKEIRHVEKLIRNLYETGVDALIVQDMGILRMDIPPIELHASTQCHISTVEKAQFLQQVGFSQLVLARELSLAEIRNICSNVDIPVEVFVHGALCVSYSGRCHASQQAFGRSANRGECAQICRLPFSLTDSEGKVLVKDQHLLSLKDLNRLARIEDLIQAGVSSFKIEGRLKDAVYVKNTVAAYNRRIEEIIKSSNGRFYRPSSGRSDITFNPDLKKSFNRGFTGFWIDGKPSTPLSSPLTPKSLGEEIKNISDLNNGDGIAFFDRDDNYVGLRINKIEGDKIYNTKNIRINPGTKIFRTYNRLWENELSRSTAIRKIGVTISLDTSGAEIKDERGICARVPLGFQPEKSISRPTPLPGALEKLGNTIYRLDSFVSTLPADSFIPASLLADLRRRLIKALDDTAESRYHYNYRRTEKVDAKYPYPSVDYKDNISNSLAEQFYHDHGAEILSQAAEISGIECNDKIVMTSRHCILRDLGLCLKEKKSGLKLPLHIKSNNLKYRLGFDCDKCNMYLYQE